MATKRSVPPATRRTFPNGWSELDYLCKKMRYWLYVRIDGSRAQRYLGRLKRVLAALPENDLAILREEGLAIRFELEGNLEQAIVHRRREIQLMERLHDDARSPQYAEEVRAYMLRDRGADVLQERRAILESLSRGNGRRYRNVTRGSVQPISRPRTGTATH